MLPSFLLALREGIEAALVIGIVLSALRKFNRADLTSAVWFGSGAAVLASLLVALVLRLIGTELSGPAEPIYEGVSMWLAAGILTWMIFWMQRQSRTRRAEIEQKVRRSFASSGRWPLVGVAFFAVFREGLELALFLLAAGLSSSGTATLLGAATGLIVAGVLGWLLFTSTLRLRLSSFFQITNVLLILFAAGLVAHGMVEFNEVGLIPALVNNVYNLAGILPGTSFVGQVLTALFGYNPAPSLSGILAYLVYFIAIGLGLFLAHRRPQPLPVRE